MAGDKKVKGPSSHKVGELPDTFLYKMKIQLNHMQKTLQLINKKVSKKK